MSPFAICGLAIHFEFTQVNGACMSVAVQVGEYAGVMNPDSAGIFVFEAPIVLPVKVHLIFSGKDMSKDTLCDSQGRIIEDKCIIIKAITLDRFPIDGYYLQKKLILYETNSNRTTQSNYIGFNGTMCLDLDCVNVFFQLQKLARIGKMDHVL